MGKAEAKLWTIEELRARAAFALTVGYEGAPNGRVRGVPDERTIRYYGTLGLLARPERFEGRTALYGRRHLLQLVAIKRLQAKGLSLEAVQRELVAASTSKLEKLAELPEAILEEPGEPVVQQRQRRAVARAEQPPGRVTFWKEAPVPVPSAVSGLDSLQRLGLEEGVSLHLSGVYRIEESEVEAVRRAAEPLLKVLRELSQREQPKAGD